MQTGLVSTDWLAGRAGADGIRVVDGSWYLPRSARDARAEYLAGHLPGAVFFDLDAISDGRSALPHMLPSAPQFAEQVGALGIGDDDDVVVYDGSGANMSAARVWWMFRAFGHERVAVLDGGLPKWRAEGRATRAGRGHPARGSLHRAEIPEGAVSRPRVRAAHARAGGRAGRRMRSAGRFAGDGARAASGSPRRSHPGQPKSPLRHAGPGRRHAAAAEALRHRIEAAGVDPARPIVATCGSGVSACTLIHALHLLGHDQVALYDGAWAEWGGHEDAPVERGLA